MMKKYDDVLDGYMRDVKTATDQFNEGRGDQKIPLRQYSHIDSLIQIITLPGKIGQGATNNM